MKKIANLLMHVALLALVAAIAAYWIIRLARPRHAPRRRPRPPPRRAPPIPCWRRACSDWCKRRRSRRFPASS
jgi:uncharacterized iron-regulated membrane protein